MKKHWKKIALGVILLVGLLIMIPVVYLNVTGSEIERICAFIEANKSNPSVLEEVRDADYVGSNLEEVPNIIHVYSVNWIGGPSCTVDLDETGMISDVTFLID